MIINVIPARCIRSADELRQIERQLNIQAAEIETVITAMKRSGDDSMIMVASKLSKTLEQLHSRIRFTNLLCTALTKIAAIYAKTEDGVSDYENPGYLRRKVDYRSTTISRDRSRIRNTFNRL